MCESGVKTLEERVALWADVGEQPYTEVFEFQKYLHDLRVKERIPDIIIAATHPLEINFGSNERDNLFSDTLRAGIQEALRGEKVTQEKIIDVLNDKGVNFSKTRRGGGATVMDKGQFFYHPVVGIEPIVDKELTGLDLTGIGDYKNLIDEVMLDTLRSFGVEGLQTVKTGYNKLIGRERRDVWLDKGLRSYKLGSKGVVVRRGVGYNGFSLYVHREAVENFSLVKPCGYSHMDLSVSTVEDETGIRVSKNQVDETVKENIGAKFGYDRIEQYEFEDVPDQDEFLYRVR